MTGLNGFESLTKGHSMPTHPKSEKFPECPSQILMKIGSNAHLRI